MRSALPGRDEGGPEGPGKGREDGQGWGWGGGGWGGTHPVGPRSSQGRPVNPSKGAERTGDRSEEARMQHRAGLEEEPARLQHMETDSLKGPSSSHPCWEERAGAAAEDGGGGKLLEVGALRDSRRKRTLTGDMEPIRDQSKRGNLCIGQRKRNSPSGRPQGDASPPRSCGAPLHRTETPDAGTPSQERGGGTCQTDTHGLTWTQP